MMPRVHTWTKRFCRDEHGAITVELVIIIPILFWGYLTMYSIFDAYRQHAANQKMAYAVGDIISRETNPLDHDYLNGMRNLAVYMTAAKDDTEVAVRVSVVKWDNGTQKYELEWSEAKGWKPALSDGSLQAMKHLLPILPHEERVTVVETFVKYDPPFDTGLHDREIHNLVFTRARYAPWVRWFENETGSVDTGDT